MTESPPNLLLITIDAWRADFVDSYAGVPLTPTLTTLLPRALRFNNAYATAPWTSPALISLFSGENPALHGVHYEWSTPRPDGPALSARLQRAGYRAPNICYLNRVGNYQNLGYSAADAPDYPKGPDDDLLLRTLRELQRQGGGEPPWFLWHHYKFVHLPYWPGPAYRRMFAIDDDLEAGVPARLRESVCSRFVLPRQEFQLLADDRELVQRLYAGGVRQMDDFLGRVFAELSAGGLLDRTTVVITADHGDELLEHGHVGHASTAHHGTLYEEVLRIPLFIIDPRLPAGRVVKERVQALDLFPTLLSLCGVAVPATDDSAPASAEAVDLSPLILAGKDPAAVFPTAGPAARSFYSQSAEMGYLTPRSHEGRCVFGLSDGQKKYVFEQYGSPRRLLFDLRHDPQELRPLTSGPEVDAAHAALLDFLRGAAQKRNG